MYVYLLCHDFITTNDDIIMPSRHVTCAVWFPNATYHEVNCTLHNVYIHLDISNGAGLYGHICILPFIVYPLAKIIWLLVQILVLNALVSFAVLSMYFSRSLLYVSSQCIDH